MDFQELSVHSFIQEVVQASNGWHPRKFCFVLGAGASKASGIKSGQELVDIWDRELQERNENDYLKWRFEQDITDENKHSFYSQYYEKRFERVPSDGKNFLEGLMSSATPSAGYVTLAYILNHFPQQLNVVITTNFDHLIEDALHDYEHCLPLVVGHAALAHYVTTPFNRPTVVKIHHDLLFDPKNTTKEVSVLAKEWERALDTIFSEYHPIFIGYAGNDASLMNFLKDHSGNFASGKWKFPYWLLYKTDVLSKDIKAFIDTSGGHLIRHNGFDETLFLLGDQLNYKLPTEKEFLAGAKERFKALSRSIDMLSESMSTKNSEVLPDKATMHMVSDDSPELRQAIDRVTERAELQRMYKEAVMLDNTEKYEEALAIEAQLVKRDSSNALYHHRYGTTLGKVKRFEEAIKEMKKAVKFEPDEAYFLICLSDLLMDAGRPDEAIPYLQKGAALDSSEIYPHLALAHALYITEHFEEALSEIDEAILLDPDDAYLHNMRGSILSDLERDEDALIEFQKAVDIEPEDAMYHYDLGMSLFLNEHLEDSYKEMRQAIALEPNNAMYHHELGDILREESAYPSDLALAPDELDVDSVDDLKEANVAIEETLGKLDDHENENAEGPFFDLELLAQAIVELKKAAELAPENAIFQYDLGDALWDSGELDAAAFQVQKALALDPDNDQYKTTLSRIATQNEHRARAALQHKAKSAATT